MGTSLLNEKNNYIFEYYQKIRDGSIVVGKYIEQVYEKIISDLQEKRYFFDNKKAYKAIKYIENFCHHHEGALAPQLLKLELWQKALISCIFGLVNEKGKRQFAEVVVVMGRKNGKTLLASAISNYCLIADGEYGARIYFAAPRLQQAALCFDALYQSITHEEEIMQMTKKRKTDLYIASSNSSASPLAFSSKRSDGFNISTAICDEIASWSGDQGLKFYEVIKSSFGAREQPLLVSITTSGYVNDSIYDELIKRSTRMLNGESRESKLLPFLYMIDDSTKWNDINELQKSNPNLNVSISVDYLLEEIAIAEGSLSKKSEFLTKYCNLKQTSSMAWLRSSLVESIFSGKPLKFEDFKKNYAVVGIDLSQTTDLCTAICLIEKDGIINVFGKAWLPANSIEEAIARDRVPYDIYIKRGFLELSGENYIDYHDCERWIVDLVKKYQIMPLVVGYDRYSAQYLVQDLNAMSFKTDDVYQGDNLYGVLMEMEGLFKDGKVNCGDNDLIKLHLLDAAIKMNNERGRGRLVKIYPNAHIDFVAAMSDAFCVRQKWNGQYGEMLKNNRK